VKAESFKVRSAERQLLTLGEIVETKFCCIDIDAFAESAWKSAGYRSRRCTQFDVDHRRELF